MRKRTLIVAIALAAAAVVAGPACSSPPPPPVGAVKLYVAPGLPGAALAELARGFEVAAPTLVPSLDEAEVAWLADPTEAIALAARLPLGAAPEQPGLPGRYLDKQRRFAPLGAIAWVLVAPARPAGGFEPDELSELGDPRVRGRVALPRLDRGNGPMLVAALDLAYGERGTRGWLGQLAGNAPQLAESEGAVAARVASGAARVGLVDSLTAAAAARDGLRVVFPDQAGGGAVAIPTALVLLPRAGPGARRLAAWLAGPTAERVLTAHAPGLLALRDDGATAPGFPSVGDLKVVSVDWSALAERERTWTRRLVGWPRVPLGEP